MPETREVTIPTEEVKLERPKMKVAHFASWTPFQSGLWSVSLEQVKYERKAGLDSRFVDCDRENPLETPAINTVRPEPGGWKWAEKEADVWVMHRVIPPKIQPRMKEKACVAVLHAVTEYMMIAENMSMATSSEFNFHINLVWGKELNYARTVVPNPQDYEIMKLYDVNGRLRMIQEGVDLEYWSPDGFRWGFLHHPAIMSSDVPRFNKLPAHIIWAMPRIAERIPDARLNVFGLYLENIVTWRNVFVRSKERKLQTLTENIRLERMSDLRPFFRGADILFNNQVRGTASRNTQEALACGCPVISYNGGYTRWHPRVWDLDSIAETVEEAWNRIKDDPEGARKEARGHAANNFDINETAKKYVKLYGEILDERRRSEER